MTRWPSFLLITLFLAFAGPSTAVANALEDRMMDLNIAPLEPATPPALVVTTLEGARVTLADVRGKAVLIYFWATW
jgi:cytochrome oxidase Cu insertion factor (SCO1/SenC/PrrC family)